MGGIDSFEENGCAIVERVFTAAQCDAVVQAISGAPSHTGGSLKNGKAGVRHLLSNPGVSDLANDERLLEIARQALSAATAIPFRATLFHKTSKANWLIPWHQDTALPLALRFDHPAWGPWSEKGGVWYAHAPEWALKQVVALRVHLDASTEANGPLRVFPKTHGRLLEDAEIEARVVELADAAVECLSPVGGVIVMRPLLIHASSKIVNDLPRRVLHVEYAASLTLSIGIELRKV